MFTLKSDNLGSQATLDEVANTSGCKGKNRSPQLRWANPPEGTQSYALTMYDPDAPTGSGWWHWLAFNIPTEITDLAADSGNPNKNMMPEGVVQSRTDFGNYGYGGPCPPEGHGFHAYIVTVYALSVPKIDLDKDASPGKVGFNLNANTLAKASLIFYHAR